MAPNMCVAVILGLLATFQFTLVLSQTAVCRQQLDVCVAMDTSDFNLESFSRLGKMKEALKSYLRMYDIGFGNNNDQVGICLYGTQVSTPILLGEDQDMSVIEQKIGAVSDQNVVTGFSIEGGFVNTHLGLRCCRNMLATRGRYNKRDLTVLMALGNTEIRARPETALLADEMRNTGHLSVVTIGTSFSDISEFASYASETESVSAFNTYDQIVLDPFFNPPSAFHSWCPRVAANPCDGCIWQNGIGYVAGPDCWEYYQCTVVDDQVVPRLLKTAFGTFWDQTRLTLREPSMDWTCPQDRCQSLVAGAQFGRPDNCRIYMQCRSDVRSTAHIGCCEEGMRFIDGLGCIVDASCNDNCTISAPTETERCQLLPVQGIPAKFRLGGSIMDCSPGTYFSADMCACVMATHQTVNVCNPDLDLAIDEAGIRDVSVNRYDVINDGVFVNNLGNGQYSAVFHNSSLRILGFSNRDLRDKFTIHMRIRPTSEPHFDEAIVSNSDCELGRDTYSVVLDSIERIPNVKGFAQTVPDGQAETTPIFVAEEGFIDVVYSYNGVALSMFVRDNLGATSEVSPPAGNLIELRQPSCAMIIGNSLARNAYQGEISEFKVFMGCQRDRLEDYMRS